VYTCAVLHHMVVDQGEICTTSVFVSPETMSWPPVDISNREILREFQIIERLSSLELLFDFLFYSNLLRSPPKVLYISILKVNVRFMVPRCHYHLLVISSAHPLGM
jgi:hypothetical protein